MGSLGELSGGLSTYHLPEEPRLLHAWRLALRLTLLATASLLLLMFLSQKAHASDGSSEAASSRASASADASGSDASGQSGQARAHNHWAGGPKSWFQAGKLGRFHGHKGESRSGAPADDPESIGPPAASDSGGSTDQASSDGTVAPQVATDQGSTTFDVPAPPASAPAPAAPAAPALVAVSDPAPAAPASDPAPAAPSDPAPTPASDPAPAADDGGSASSPSGGSDEDSGTSTVDTNSGYPTSDTTSTADSGSTSTGSDSGTADSGTDAPAAGETDDPAPSTGGTTAPDSTTSTGTATTTDASATTTDASATTTDASATTTDASATTTDAPVATGPAVVGPMGPTNPAAPTMCLAPVGPLTTGVAGLGLLITTPLPGGFTLLGHGLIATALPGSGLRLGLSDVIEHVRDLARQAKTLPGKTPNGTDPSPLPAPMPAPPPAPPAPAEQSSGSSVSTGSHNHHKGGSSHAILGGALLVFYLRPLGLSRMASASGFSRSFRPLALPG